MNNVNSTNSTQADQLPPEKIAGQTIQSPGILILAWSLWLLGSWGVTLLLDPSIRAVRWMILVSFFGLMVIYPAVRLSQSFVTRNGDEYSNHPLSRLRVLFDWLALYAVFQAVIWPLRISTDWSADQTLWLNVAIGAWSLLVAAIVATAGTYTASLPRVAAMLLCIAVLLGEPMVMAWLNVGASEGEGVFWQMVLSPLQIIWSLTSPSIEYEPGRYQLHITTIAIIAVTAWVWVGIFGFLHKK